MDAKALIAKAVPLQRSNRHAEARELYRQVLAEEPRHASALHLLGLSFAETQDFEQGLPLIEQAVSLRPKETIFRVNLGVVFRRMGRFDRARECFRAVIEQNPLHGEAWSALVESQRYSEAGSDLDAVLRALEQVNDKTQQRYLHFSAGKVLDDLGDYDRAFHHFSAGNALGPQDFDAEAYLAACRNIADIFSPAFFSAGADLGLPGPRPIFLVGMPRSGSSLLERILSQHSAVAAVGEVHDIAGIVSEMAKRFGDSAYPRCVANVPAEAYAGFAGAYLQRMASLVGSPELRSVDKNLFNRMYVGTVRLMFPNAVIIHCQRSLLDTALSCFFQNFSSGQSFSFKLQHIAASIEGCERLMAHWRDVLPGGIVTADYESLIRSPEATVRSLLSESGLAWESDCLSYADKPGYVATASSWQARQPLYSHSLERWRNYEKHLGPLRELIDS
ncbi:MAG: sulfotransferase [Pseudomonadota bacterium]